MSFEQPLSVDEIKGADLERIKLAIPLSAESFPQLQSLTFVRNLKVCESLLVFFLKLSENCS